MQIRAAGAVAKECGPDRLIVLSVGEALEEAIKRMMQWHPVLSTEI